MTARRNTPEYELILINDFDRRRDYKRRGYELCNPQGWEIFSQTDKMGRRPIATAKVWRNRMGRTVVRFSKNDFVCHFEALLVSGKQIPEDNIQDYILNLGEDLTDWYENEFDRTITVEERLERIAIKAFKQHWAKILRSLEKGKNTYANKRYRHFEADTVERQKILANKFYGIDHARKMVALSNDEIKRNLSCYLPIAIEYALDTDNPNEQEALLNKLVSDEYVVFDYDELDDEELSLAADYDNWYEGKLAGFFPPPRILMKSTGEGFSKTEVNWLKKSIQYNIDSNKPDALWWFACEPIAKNRLLIRIKDFVGEEDDYVDEYLCQLGILSKNQLKEFVRQILELLSIEKKFKKKLSVFNNYESLTKKTLLDIIESFFMNNLKALSDMDIRTVENAMNGITGWKDRDYHELLYY